jgi:hypothetical protein
MAGSFQFLHSRDLVWTRRMREYLMGETRTAQRPDGLERRHHAPAGAHAPRVPDRALPAQRAGHRPLPRATAGPCRCPTCSCRCSWSAPNRDHVSPWRSVYKLHHLCEAESNLRAGRRRAQRRHRQRARTRTPSLPHRPARTACTVAAPRELVGTGRLARRQLVAGLAGLVGRALLAATTRQAPAGQRAGRRARTVRDAALGAWAAEGVEAKRAKTEYRLVAPTSPGWAPGRRR